MIEGSTFDNTDKETPEALEWFVRNTYVIDDVLHWMPVASSGRKRSAVYSGKPCGCLSKRGYIQVRMGKDKFMAHRILWAMRCGSWPVTGIDHINGNKTDNRASNMREVTQFSNSKNAEKYKRKEPWIATGVSRHGIGFRADAQVDNKRFFIGLFKCHTAAMVARKLFDIGKGFTVRHGTTAHEPIWRE